MNNDNLDSFITMTIKLIEQSESNIKEKINDLKVLVDNSIQSNSDGLSGVKSDISSIKTDITNIKTDNTITNTIAVFKFSRSSKLITALVAFLLTCSSLLLRFKSEISEFFK